MSASPHTLAHLRPAVQDSLRAMQVWFNQMQDPTTHRMAYKYLPQHHRHVWEESPIREIGTAADLAALENFTGIRDCDKAIQVTLNHYEKMLQFCSNGTENAAVGPGSPSKTWAFLDSEALGEPSCIAHSSMMILALCGASNYLYPEKRSKLVLSLARGVCKQQESVTGRFKIYFSPPPGIRHDSGWELYSGEAELALATAHGFLRNKDPEDVSKDEIQRFLDAAVSAFMAYQLDYQQGRVRDHSFVFYANWQCQAGKELLKYVRSGDILAHMVDLQDNIVIRQRFFSAVSRMPHQASVVEVACAMEGLLATYASLLKYAEEGLIGQEERLQAYEQAIIAGVKFLVKAQARKVGDEVREETGGFGFSLDEPTQRIDVTGHVCCAFLQLLEILDSSSSSGGGEGGV